MPKYKYTAVDIENKKVTDIAEARNEAELGRLLRGQKLVLIKCKDIQAKTATHRLKANETAEFSRQLASMLGSGITVVRAMDIIKERDFKPPLKLVYERLHRDVQLGFTLSEAMKLQGRAFPELFVNMYASGEASGQLEQVAQKMAVHFDKEHRLNGKVKSAMTYPMVLFGVTVIVIMLIFTVILPTFFTLFEDIEIPALTRGIIAVSAFLQKYWYMLIIGLLVFIALWQFITRYRSVALQVDTVKLKLPVIGKLLKIIYTARFARTLSSLYSSGLSMITALEISATIIRNTYIEDQFGELIKDVRNGDPLSRAVGAVDGFDVKLPASILIGEESGRLDSLLESTADSFDYEAEMATGRMVQLLEPAMIIFMAAVICFVMLAVMTPLLTLYQSIGGM